MFHDVLCDWFMNETADGIDDVIMSKDVVEMKQKYSAVCKPGK